MAAVRSAAMLRRTLLTVVAAAAVLAGCGDDPDPPSTSQAARPPGTSVDATSVPAPDTTGVSGTAPGGDEEAAVLAAVDCYWQTIVEANDPPNPDHPGFTRCFTGAALERSVSNARERMADGERIQEADGVVDVAVSRVVERSADRVVVRQCVVDNAVRRRTVDDSVIDDAVMTLDVQLVVERHGQQWLVSSNQTLSSTEGVVPCGG